MNHPGSPPTPRSAAWGRGSRVRVRFLALVPSWVHNRSVPMSPRVVVIGSSNTDLVVCTPRLPVPGETIVGEEFEVHAGGKGANQAVAAVRAPANLTFVAAIGRDAFGDGSLLRLEREGIATRWIARDSTSRAAWRSSSRTGGART